MNKKDKFPQMTKWLECREKVLQHAKYIEWHVLHAQYLADSRNSKPAATDEKTRW